MVKKVESRCKRKSRIGRYGRRPYCQQLTRRAGPSIGNSGSHRDRTGASESLRLQDTYAPVFTSCLQPQEFRMTNSVTFLASKTMADSVPTKYNKGLPK